MNFSNLTPARSLVAVMSILAAATAFAQSADLASKPASPATLAAQKQMAASMPADDGQDEEFARRGFIATPGDSTIKSSEGKVLLQIDQLDWIKGEAPPTVNPSLWRHMKILKEHGLFKVADGVWQLRGIDTANMGIVRGKTGWIVIDPLTTTETASVAMALVDKYLGKRPVSAIIYGHSHPDHFGGAAAVITPGTKPRIFAPERLVEETVSEYVIAGNVMNRRGSYMLATPLKPGPQGFVGVGLFVPFPNTGTITLVRPTDWIKRTGETRMIDGVKFEFQMVPETEAPSEMNFYMPAQRTLYVSEDATCVMHNIQTPRGALVRDAYQWAWYLTETVERYGDRAESLITGHCWPRFGNKVIKNTLLLQRDNYKFIHDQTVRRMNDGEPPLEIADKLKRPAAIENQWSNRGYYGTVKHNAKGVFQRYIGWWDGIPAHLDMLPPDEDAKRYVAAMGGADAVIANAKTSMEKGEYRWAAEILNQAVFADAGNGTARALLADSYEQMGYQAESAVWRNIYLTGAAELRHAVVPTHLALSSPDLIAAMPTEMFLELVETRLDPAKIGDRSMSIMVDDAGTKSLVSLRNAVLVAQVGKSIPHPDVTVSGDRRLLMGLFVKKSPLDQLESAGLKVSGDRDALLALVNAIEPPPPNFPVVEP